MQRLTVSQALPLVGLSSVPLAGRQGLLALVGLNRRFSVRADRFASSLAVFSAHACRCSYWSVGATAVVWMQPIVLTCNLRVLATASRQVMRDNLSEPHRTAPQAHCIVRYPGNRANESGELKA